MSKFILIVEHDSGKTRYFGPYFSSEEVIKAADFFGYENSPYSVSAVEMKDPLSFDDFLACKEQDNEV